MKISTELAVGYVQRGEPFETVLIAAIRCADRSQHKWSPYVCLEGCSDPRGSLSRGKLFQKYQQRLMRSTVAIEEITVPSNVIQMLLLRKLIACAEVRSSINRKARLAHKWASGYKEPSQSRWHISGCLLPEALFFLSFEQYYVPDMGPQWADGAFPNLLTRISIGQGNHPGTSISLRPAGSAEAFGGY